MTGILLFDALIFITLFGLGLFSAVHERVWGALFAIGTLVIAVHLQFDVTIGRDNWFLFALGAVGYFFVGGVYALFVTWPRFLRRHASEIIRIRNDFEKAALQVGKDQNGRYTGYKNFTEVSEYRNNYAAKANKDRIVTYIATWAWDASWRVLRNPVVWAYDLVYDVFSNGFARVERNVTAKILADADNAKKE